MTPRSLLDDFFRPQSGGDVVRAVSALVTASQGEVTSAALPRDPAREFPSPHGLFSRKIFESIEDGRRIGHVLVGCGVLHPALVPEIARALGIANEAVVAIARFEAELDGGRVVARPSPPNEDDDDEDREIELADDLDFDRAGTEALAHALGERAHLLVDRVPVLPPGHRPYAPSSAPHVLLPDPGPINLAYASLVAHSGRARRLRELGAPSILIAQTEICIHDRFERLYAAVRGEAPVRKEDKPKATKYELRFPKTPTPSEPEPEPTALLFLDEDRLLLQHDDLLVELRAGKARSFDVTHEGHRARYVDPSGRWVLFSETRCGHVGDGAVVGAAILDTETGSWLETPPDALPIIVLCGETISNLRTSMGGEGLIVSEESGYPIYSRDGRFAWLWDVNDRGPVVAMHTDDICLEMEWLAKDRQPPFVLPTGELVETDPGEPNEASTPVSAIAFTHDHRWRIATDGGVVIEATRLGTKTLCTLGFRPRAVAWSPDATTLAVLRDVGSLLIVKLADDELTTKEITFRP